MCVICCKPSGADMPLQTYIDNMWNRNSDGAGIMYAVDGRVHIEKGFMSYEDFKDRLKSLGEQYDLKKLPLVMHFRITTHGGTKPENCHPFPISDSVGILSKLRQTTNIGVAHNGIIDITPRKGISDTMEYIISQLAPLSKAVPTFYKNKHLIQMISNAIDSKMAFLTNTGDIYTIGSFEKDGEIMYSNTSYKYGWGWGNYKWGHSSALALSDSWEVMDSGDQYFYRNVMWLDDGEYVKDPEGNYWEGDYAIDNYGGVYEYDHDAGALRRLWRWDAFGKEGLPLRYNSESPLVVCECVLY